MQFCNVLPPFIATFKHKPISHRLLVVALGAYGFRSDDNGSESACRFSELAAINEADMLFLSLHTRPKKTQIEEHIFKTHGADYDWEHICAGNPTPNIGEVTKNPKNGFPHFPKHTYKIPENSRQTGSSLSVPSCLPPSLLTAMQIACAKASLHLNHVFCLCLCPCKPQNSQSHKKQQHFVCGCSHMSHTGPQVTVVSGVVLTPGTTSGTRT